MVGLGLSRLTRSIEEDSSAAQADSFAGGKEGDEASPASVGMTILGARRGSEGERESSCADTFCWEDYFSFIVYLLANVINAVLKDRMRCDWDGYAVGKLVRVCGATPTAPGSEQRTWAPKFKNL